MNEKPIIFSTPMVKAILEGRKTQTRRILKNVPDDEKQVAELYEHSPEYFHEICPYGKPGDLIWVRETFCEFHFPESHYSYKAGPFGIFNTESMYASKGWKPSIHMPKAAARIWLKNTGVRVERLQDISEKDAIGEGIHVIEPEEAYFDYEFNGQNGSYATAIGSFASLWQSIHSKESWQANPWVWVINFEVLSTTGKPELS